MSVGPYLESSRWERLGGGPDVVISFEGLEISFFCFVLICETRDNFSNLWWGLSLCRKRDERV